MDLNGDGKHDWKDDMIAYHLANDEGSSNDDKPHYDEGEYRGKWAVIIIVGLIIFKIISWIVS